MADKIITSLPSDIEEALLSLTDVLRQFGVTHVGHGLIIRDFKPTAFFSSKEWADRYDKDDLVSRDPLRKCALNTNYKIVPWEYLPLTKEAKPVLEERKRVFCAKSGLLVSIKCKKFHETFVLGVDSSKYSAINIFDENFNIFNECFLKFRRTHMMYYPNNVFGGAK